MFGNSYFLDKLWQGDLNPQQYSRLEKNEEYIEKLNACMDAF